jgi:hypothetical protein
MKQYLRLIAVLCACSMLLLTGCQSSKTFSPSADATWGDLCREFDAEWYDSLAEDVSGQLDKLLLSENHSSNDNELSAPSVVPVYKEADNAYDTGYTVFSMDKGNLIYKESDLDLLDLGLMINQQDKAIDYMVSVSSLAEGVTTDITVIVAISDTKSGKYLDINKDTVTVSRDIDGIADGFKNLKHNHKYTVKAIAIVDPPEDYSSSGPLYVEKEVTTIEPTTK